MKLSKLFLSVLIAVSFFLSAGTSRAATPGIYLLFVWGTLDPVTHDHVIISKNKMEAAFVNNNSSTEEYTTAGGLADVNPYIKRKITLEGSDAHPQKILDACRELAEAAGPNDTVMVYILCHGVTIKGTDGKRRHALAPIATGSRTSELQISRFGIARGSILKAIKSKPHRLDVLITDSCSLEVPFELKEPKIRRTPASPTNTYLRNFLLKASGTLNINSSRPEYGGFPAEEARSLKAEKWMNGTPSDVKEREVYEEYAGTVFTNAFLRLAESPRFTEKECNVDKFFEKLRKELNDKYQATIGYLQETSQLTSLSKFMEQDTQTLTRFDYDSVALPEDLRFEFSNNGSSSDGGSSSSF